MPSKTDTTDTRPEAQLQARLDAKLAAGLGLVIGGLSFWLATPSPGTFEGLVLMALAVLVGSK